MPSLVVIGQQIKETQRGHNVCLYNNKITQPEKGKELEESPFQIEPTKI